MNSRRPRRRRSWAQLAAVGSLLVGAPLVAFAEPEVVAIQETPSSLSAEYGPVVPLGAGLIAAPMGNGVEIRDLGQPSVPRVGMFRTAGKVTHIAASGGTLFLFAGSRGVVAVHASDPDSLTAAGSIGGLGRIATGAAAPAGGGVLAVGDTVLHFLSWDPNAGFALLRRVAFDDGRRFVRAVARGDSFLVASTRGGFPSRLIFSLYRLRAGSSSPESLAEFAFNGHEALDLAWAGRLAFVAEGNSGVLVVDVSTHALLQATPIFGNKYVRSVASNDTVVVAGAEAKTLGRLARAGTLGDSLVPEPVRILEQDPFYVSLVGNLAVASTYDQTFVPPPDEIGRSVLEVVDLAGGPEPGPIGGTGKTRRVAYDAGLAYVADYTGGLRIYRADGADSSLVGVIPPAGNARMFDLAVDSDQKLVYLASGSGGLDVISVQDPAAPQPLTNVVLPGLATAVARLGPNLVAVARRGGVSAGVTIVFYNGSDPPIVVGSVNYPQIQEPRALAVKDSVLFVADEAIGLVSVRVANPQIPAVIRTPSGQPAHDLDLAGTRLLVATHSQGLQIVDVLNPAVPILRGSFPTPPILGVTQNGSSAALFLGEDGVLVVDVSTPSAAFPRGPIAAPGLARDGVWVGDTLLVAADFALERYIVSPTPTTVPTLQVDLDARAALPRARLSWGSVSLPGLVGLNVYRDLLIPGAGSPLPGGRRINRDLLPPSALEAFDDSLRPGLEHRYRLEAFFADGSTRKVAEGTLLVPGERLVGRPFPNPFLARGGASASLSYRLPEGAAGTLTLRVFDAAGRLVRTVGAPVPSGGGFGRIAWDGRDQSGRRMPSGIYFLQLIGAGLDDARTITLLR